MLLGDFGTDGLHAYDGFTWTALASADPTALAGADLDSDGIEEVYAAFSNGVFRYNSDDSTWTRLTSSQAQQMLIWNNILVIDFGTSGLYTWDGAAWTRLTTSDAHIVTTVDFDGPGGADE